MTTQAEVDAAARVLVKFSEECGETVQAVSKLLLHGPASKGGNNMNNLHIEAGDVLACIKVLVQVGILDKHILRERRDFKAPQIKADYYDKKH